MFASFSTKKQNRAKQEHEAVKEDRYSEMPAILNENATQIRKKGTRRCENRSIIQVAISSVPPLPASKGNEFHGAEGSKINTFSLGWNE